MRKMYDEFLLFCKNSDFYVDEKQDMIIRQIFDNIRKDTLIQIILMPNATGKTNLSLLLSCFFAQKELKILRYAPFELPGDYGYLPHVKSNSELMETVEHANAGTVIHHFRNKLECDYVIADGLAYTDISTVKKQEIFEKLEDVITKPVDENNTLSQTQLEWLGQLYLAKTVAHAKAKIIIFMKNNDLKLCEKSVFIFSKKKKIIDVYDESKNCESNTKVKREETSPNAYDVMQEFKKYFDCRMDRVENKINDIHNKVSEMHEIMNSLNQKVSNQKAFLSSYAEITDDEEVLERALERVLNKLAEQLNEEITQYEKLNSFQQYKQLVRIRMGDDAWNKLSYNSQRFLITAKFTFAEHILLGDSIDYSSICLLASKAFEIELAKRFVTEYEKYLMKRFGKSYGKWPSSIIKIEKNGNLCPMTEEEFMLGACPYIMGILSKDRNVAQFNKQCFYDYCKSMLIKDEALDGLDKILASFDKQIKTIKDKYRNPAAHKESIGLLEASECMDYILEVERVLKVMLESFKY